MTELLVLCLKATLLLGLAFLVAGRLREVPASRRHAVWAATLAGLLLLPAVSLWAPVLPLPLLPAAQDATSLALPTPARETTVAVVTPAAPALPAPTHEKQAVKPTLVGLLATVYLAGVVAVLLHLATGLIRIRRLTGRAPILEDPNWSELLDRQGGRRRIALRTSSEIAVPITWGALRPTTILPSDAESWQQQHRRQAFEHELAHVRRLDWLTQLGARMICALYWFHPLVWLAARRLALEAERACDDRVLLSGAASSDYAEHLLSLAKRLRARPIRTLAAVTMARRSQLPGRIATILDPRTRRTDMTRSRWIPFALSTLTLAVLIASAQLVPATTAVAAELPEDAPVLLHAAEDGDVDLARRLLEEGADPDQASPGHGTPLIVAATRGDEELVRLLLDHGADVNRAETGRPRPTGLQRTALNGAARGGHAGVLRMLLDAGAEVDRRVSGDGTALIEAARGGHLESVELLLSAGADADRKVSGDGSPLISAARGGYSAVVERLLDAGANPNRTVAGDGSPLIAAMRSGDQATVNTLLDAGADPDLGVAGDGNPLLAAAAQGAVELVEELIAYGADVEAAVSGDGNALIAAVRAGNEEAVEALLAAGARADAGVAGDGSALIQAAARGDVAMVQRMLATGADADHGVAGDGSPLIAAARSGNVEVVQLLVDSGADVDKVVRGDENPLIQASWAGHLEVVQYLIDQGADVNARVKANRREIRTPLRQARRGGHDEVAELLISAGAVY